MNDNYIRLQINPLLKRQFKKWCIDNSTTMSKVISDQIRKIVESELVYTKENSNG